MKYSLAAEKINEAVESGKGVLVSCKSGVVDITWEIFADSLLFFHLDEQGLHSELNEDKDDEVHINLNIGEDVVFDELEDTYHFPISGNDWVLITIL